MQVVELVGEAPSCESCRGDEHCSSEEDKIRLRRSEKQMHAPSTVAQLT